MKMKVEMKVQTVANMWMKSIVWSSLSMGVVDDIRSALGHDEGSASKLVGIGCSELWRVYKDRRSLSDIILVSKEWGRYVKM